MWFTTHCNSYNACCGLAKCSRADGSRYSVRSKSCTGYSTYVQIFSFPNDCLRETAPTLQQCQKSGLYLNRFNWMRNSEGSLQRYGVVTTVED